MEPRIYIYKITFIDQPFWYWGVHKEKTYGEPYWGTPITNKEYWSLYEPAKEILEVFEYSEKGWQEALRRETELIKPDLNNPLCLNKNCGGRCSPEVTREYWSNKENRDKVSLKQKELWKDPEFAERQLLSRRKPETRKKKSEQQKERWEDPDYRDRVAKSIADKWTDPEYRNKQVKSRSDSSYREKISERMSSTLKELWNDPEYIDKQSKEARERWEDPEYRAKCLESMNKLEVRNKHSLNASTNLRERWKDDTYREKMREIARENWKDPSYRDNICKKRKEAWRDEDRRREASERAKKRCQDPEYKAKRSGWIWITDGTKNGNKQLAQGLPIPKGFYRGRTI